MSNYLQGLYKPTHPEKYKGDVKNIVYRSSWELTYMRRLDLDENVLKWSSESVIIPYYHPISRSIRRYFVDFWVEYKDEQQQTKRMLVEIKPASQRKPPVNTGKKKKKTLLKEQLTYVENQSKWEAATKYCEKKGWDFVILSEKDLGR